MKYPKISIITVSLNQAKFIEDNIISVINQHYPNIEHIIIDGASTDGTIDILKRYGEQYKHIKWVSEPDNGQSEALNKGFKMATGEIIGWINSDDRLHPNSLWKIAKFFLENPTEIAVVGDQAIIDEKGQILRIIKSREYTFDYLVNYAKGITQNSTFFKREIFDQIGYLDENLNYVMDRDLFIRITKIKHIPYIPEVLAEFRIHSKTKTSKGSYYFAKELIKIRLKYGAKIYSKGVLNDIYIILTEPFRRISWLRKFVRKLKGIDT